MVTPIVFMFPGQGSQYYLMGKELYNHHPVFRKRIEELDGIVVDLTGESVLQTLYNEKNKISDSFSRIKYTHPAIFMVECALAQVMVDRGLWPDAVLGSSLGEFAAAVFSGIISIEDGLEMVVKQAEIFETCFKSDQGTMLTILYSPDLYYENSLLYDHTELAAINYNNHFVISGKKQALLKIEHFLKQRNISFLTLPVSFAFHSRWIEPAGPAYYSYLKKKQFKLPNCTFISSVTGSEISQLPHDYFWQTVRKPIVFREAIKNLEKKQNHIYLDLGPSGTLANFVKNNLKESTTSIHFTVISPFGSDIKRLQQYSDFILTNRPFQIKKEKSKMNVFMFPGQGSQKKGMGEGLFEEFADLTKKADKILGYSIRELCLEDPGSQLMQTQFTQPAIYVVNALSYYKRIRDESKPDYVLGHSVAEFNALLASGVVNFETGLKLVKKRGELMAGARKGGMAAVMGLAGEQVEKILNEIQLENLYIANYNSSYQIVISGLKEEIEQAEPLFLKNGATHYRILNVSGAFHTPYMADAKKVFAQYARKFKFGDITIPIISNVTARPYKQQEIQHNIIAQITSPVRWVESIRYLLAKGVDIEDFHEISGVGISVVKALAMRINHEAGPLDLSNEEAEQQETNIERTIPTTPVEKIKEGNGKITAQALGSKEFKQDYHLKFPYVAGGMYKGIASKEMVVKMGKAGMMGFFGSGGLDLSEIEAAIRYIKKELDNGQAFGMNLVSNPMDPEIEEKLVDLFLKHGIHTIEAAAFLMITPALVKYRANELKEGANGEVLPTNKIIAKLSRPEVAEQFLSPAPERIVKKLLEAGQITQKQMELLKKIPMADDLIIEADSGGHTDQGRPYTLMPAMLKLRDHMMRKHNFSKVIRVGAAGGIGTPEAAAAAFVLGADFIVTGSINQCTVEASTSTAVKDLLQEINVQDTDYAPAGDMFELGARVQVLKRGVFFPARANKLYDLYRHYNSIDEIDEKTKTQLQEKYFKRTFEEIYQEVKSFYTQEEIEKAERNPKYKLALIFRWYFGYSTQLALNGHQTDKINYQIQCGPALGAFNQWVKGTTLENWRNRHVDEIGVKLIHETADLLSQRFQTLSSQHQSHGEE
jgi:trans-AT polyketide synthase, acyltransferase and oxidoreductase domains